MGRESKAKVTPISSSRVRPGMTLRDRINDEGMGPVRPNGAFDHSGCPACGAHSITKHWCPGYEPRVNDNKCFVPGQHLHGACQACSFPWREQVQNADTLGEKASPLESSGLIVPEE